MSNRNQSGQMTVEMVLITVALFGIVQLVSNTFNGEQYVRELVQSPWTRSISGMIENGVWGSPRETRAFHPNNKRRHASLIPTN